MQAIVNITGHQYTVKKGDVLRVQTLNKNEGEKVSFDVLALLDSDVKLGTPLVAGAKVEAKVLKNLRGSKIDVFVFKRRKGYHKGRGHRQELSQIMIENVIA